MLFITLASCWVRVANGLFARANKDDANTVAHKAHAPINSVDADRVIERISAAFTKRFGRALTVPIEKIRAFSDLPQAILASAAAQGVKATAGRVLRQRCICRAGKPRRRGRCRKETIFHEMFGHAAVRALFNDAYDGHLSTLLTRIGGWEGLRSIAIKNKIDLSKYLDGLQADQSLTDTQKASALMDELLAHLAEQGPSFKQTVRWFLGAMRNLLRRLGFAKLAEYNDNDLAYLLVQAKKSLATGAPATASGALARFADTDKPLWYSALQQALAGVPLFSRCKQPSQAKPLQFTGNELGDKDQSMADLRDRARQIARQFADQTVKITSDGAQVFIPWNNGIKHALSGNVSLEEAIVATQLDELIRRGIPAGTVPDRKGRPDIKAVHFYNTPVVIAGKHFVMRIVVRETTDGKRFYDHAENRETASGEGSENLTGSVPGPTPIQLRPEDDSSIDDSGSAVPPLFSRGNSFNDISDMLRSNATLGTITSSIKAAIGADPQFAHFNAYDKSFSTQYNKARKDADFRAVFEPVQQQVDDTAYYAIEAERLVDLVTNDAIKWNDGDSDALFARTPKDDTHAIADNAENPFSADRYISRVHAAFLYRFDRAVPVRIHKVRVIGDLLLVSSAGL